MKYHVCWIGSCHSKNKKNVSKISQNGWKDRKKILDERRSVDDPGWLGGALATTGCVVVLVVPDLAEICSVSPVMRLVIVCLLVFCSLVVFCRVNTNRYHIYIYIHEK